MKILFSDNSLWGLLNFRGCIIQHFLLKGYEIVLVAPMDQEGAKMSIPKYVKYIPVTMNRAGTNPIADIQYFYHIKNIYKIEQPDYIFHYTVKPNIYGTLAAKLLKIRSAAMVAGLGYAFVEKTFFAYLARILYKCTLRYAEQVFVLNECNYNTLIDTKIVHKSKLKLLRGGEGVDLSKFSYRKVQDNKKPRFLMVSRLLYDKGYSEYIDAANKLRYEALFSIMGAIDPRPTAVPIDVVQADVASGSIEYIAYAPDVISQMEQADCIVLPSYSEGLSRVLMEACAIGRPIICSDIPGCRETVEDGINGFLCQAKDSESLISCCKKFISLSFEEKLAMGEASRRRAELLFDEKKVIQQYDQLLGSK